MDDLYLDGKLITSCGCHNFFDSNHRPLALGITDEDDVAELKGTKKKKGKKIDDPDFMVCFIIHSARTLLTSFILLPLAHGQDDCRERSTQGGTGYSSDSEPQGFDEPSYTRQGSAISFPHSVESAF